MDPPTPSSEPPKDREQWRFHELNDPEEWIEDYRPGKLHPVHYGDTFKGAQYQVIRKLGYGSFSTVWLAKDKQNHRHVALKIPVAGSTAGQHELAILQQLSQSASTHPGRKHITHILDHFQHIGPNGTHCCMVFDIMGPSTASALFKLRQFKQDGIELPGGVGPWIYTNRFPLWMAKSILRQALLGIDFLHQNGIAHGDIQPGNLLFSLKDLNAIPESQLAWKIKSKPVQRLDGKPDQWAPQYLAQSRSLTEYVDWSESLMIRISDFGGAFPFSDPPVKSITPVSLRSPELVFANIVNKDQDLWSLGCLVFEIVTGKALFAVDSFGPDEETDDDHLIQFNDILGPLPSHLLAQYPRAHIYCNDKGEVTRRYIEELEDDESDSDYPPLPCLEEQFDKAKPPEMGDEEAQVIKVLLRQMLNYDAAKRPSSGELLRHPWFN
ncbi:hypothetical protein ASPZODRAFT_137379 [Penicilliopsis zonata CBS 506.65]|uniref:non-specific serine/threonine protein kinase n=1 Tax=Penicilliopsis zonata CBS 506.65 TaxID=1073090 RepID=A0A1L9S563_9EURO|nr:hypothetical protein ASPZODRAFT_137379 [Penicilliopsis zonata CBS 506.65]OJJ42296.1 hypothetical protein ASPZODRAFT_137379 [Penicilliopsis zonata CBS 506.65]